jgi:hypothetical protein
LSRWVHCSKFEVSSNNALTLDLSTQLLLLFMMVFLKECNIAEIGLLYFINNYRIITHE